MAPDARKMLGLKHLHLKRSRTGILDYIFDLYEARNTREAISFEDWIANEYDNVQVQAGYEATHNPKF